MRCRFDVGGSDNVRFGWWHQKWRGGTLDAEVTVERSGETSQSLSPVCFIYFLNLMFLPPPSRSGCFIAEETSAQQMHKKERKGRREEK